MEWIPANRERLQVLQREQPEAGSAPSPFACARSTRSLPGSVSGRASQRVAVDVQLLQRGELVERPRQLGRARFRRGRDGAGARASQSGLEARGGGCHRGRAAPACSSARNEAGSASSPQPRADSATACPSGDAHADPGPEMRHASSPAARPRPRWHGAGPPARRSLRAQRPPGTETSPASSSRMRRLYPADACPRNPVSPAAATGHSDVRLRLTRSGSAACELLRPPAACSSQATASRQPATLW